MPKPAGTPWLTEPEHRAWRAFVRAHALLGARLNRELQQESGLSGSDYEVLVHLSEADGGMLRPFELGGALQWEKSRVSHQLTRMEQRGLVERRDCPTDARGSYIVLTKQGRRAVEAAAPAHVEDVRRWFVEPLTRAQLESLTGAAEALIAQFDSEEAACAGNS